MMHGAVHISGSFAVSFIFSFFSKKELNSENSNSFVETTKTSFTRIGEIGHQDTRIFA